MDAGTHSRQDQLGDRDQNSPYALVSDSEDLLAIYKISVIFFKGEENFGPVTTM
jgi:hypothetical protein